MGLQTFDAALYKLYNAGKISLEEALKNADGANNLRLKIELSEKGGAVMVAGDEGESVAPDGEGEKAAKDDPLAGLSLLSEAENDESGDAEDAGVASFSLPNEEQNVLSIQTKSGR